MDDIRFVIHAAPRGKDRPRQTTIKTKDGKVRSFFHTTNQTIAYEKLIQKEFAAQVGSIGIIPKSIPLKMEIKAYFPIIKSTTKKNRKLIQEGKILPTKKPDGDNIAKIIEDALNKIAYEDDSQIVCLSIEKLYADINEEGHVEVTISSYIETKEQEKGPINEDCN